MPRSKSAGRTKQAPLDPAREAHRRMMEEDRQRREAEFEARHRQWTYAAADSQFGGKERAEREHAEAIARRKAEEAATREAQEKRRAEEKREQARKRRAEAKKRRADPTYDPDAEWVNEFKQRFKEEARLNPARGEQIDRDEAYGAYLESLGATQAATIFRNLAWSALITDSEYGIGPKARFYSHVPPTLDVSFLSPPDESFAVLGLNPLADLDQIKSAYRTLAKTHHPDAGGDAAEFCRIKAAYDRCQAVVRATSPP